MAHRRKLQFGLLQCSELQLLFHQLADPAGRGWRRQGLVTQPGGGGHGRLVVEGGFWGAGPTNRKHVEGRQLAESLFVGSKSFEVEQNLARGRL